MTIPDDAYWDDLGIAWRTVDADAARLGPQLKVRLRRQSLAIATAVAAGLPVAAAGAVLGIVTIWIGWTTSAWNFVIRGVAIELIAAMLLKAAASFLPLRQAAETQALSDMLDAAIARTTRTLVAVRMGIAACAIAGVSGVIGAVIRRRSGTGPQLSPAVDVAILVIVALCLWLYGRGVENNRLKFEYLRRMLGSRG